MRSPTFKTTEVAQLYEEIRPWSHPDFPFLDAKYSPGSSMPAIDFTPYIAAWLEAGKEEAVVEFWTCLTGDSPAEISGIRKALTARLPAWVGLSDSAKHELHAIYILTLRAAWGRTPNMANVGASVAATNLACRQLTLPPDYEKRGDESMADLAHAGKPIVLAPAYSQELLKVIRSEVDETNLGSQYGKDEGARLALEKATAPLEIAEDAAAKLKSVPPMARRVVYDLFTRGWGGGVMRLDLYYSDRVYGCGAQANRQYMDWLGFFSPPTDQASVPPALTKDKLLEGLSERGIKAKKSTPRTALIEQTRSVPGLMSSLIGKYCPEQCNVLAEWNEPLKEWALRVRHVEPVAAALIKILGGSTIKRKK
jgi:hypothetical protein